jgi:amidohydrolase
MSNNKSIEVLQQAKKLKPWAVKHRRYLHQHPELSLYEKETAEYCKNVLVNMGYKIKKCWGYGFVADLKIFNAKKYIAFRADMDALAGEEKNAHAFKSRRTGVAHLCGHDVHMAIALTTAKILKDNTADLTCNVRFIFQPSEEILPGGALGMIKNGCLDSVQEIYGLHVWPNAGGKIATRIGALMASIVNFDITIEGKSCHAAQPEKGLNPITAAAYLITKYNDIPRKFRTPFPPILSITICNSGTAQNIIPNTATISGTMRSLKSSEIKNIRAIMERHMESLRKDGYKISANFSYGYDCLINKSYGVGRVVNAASKILGQGKIDQNMQPTMGAEDFSYYLQKTPGAYFMLSCSSKSKSTRHPIHSSYFDVDENAIPIGAAIMAAIAFEYKK